MFQKAKLERRLWVRSMADLVRILGLTREETRRVERHFAAAREALRHTEDFVERIRVLCDAEQKFWGMLAGRDDLLRTLYIDSLIAPEPRLEERRLTP